MVSSQIAKPQAKEKKGQVGFHISGLLLKPEASGLDETFAHTVLINTSALAAAALIRFSICRPDLFFIVPVAFAT